MSKKLLYKRVLLKMSGEALLGSRTHGIDPVKAREIATQIVAASNLGVEIALVIGAGNLFRGISAAANGMDRTTADYMGMLAIVMNALALQDAFTQIGKDSRVLSAIPMPEICESFIRLRAIRHMEKGRIVICAAGSGNPYFSTDTAASLRALELNCDVLMKATKVDGVFDKDPKEHKDAKRFEQISFDQALAQNLRVMDSTAFALCRENKLPIRVFNLHKEAILTDVMTDKRLGTYVSNDT